MVQGKSLHLLVELEHKAYQTLKFLKFDLSVVREKRKLKLYRLYKLRSQAYESSKLYKEKVKKCHDYCLIRKKFKSGEPVLVFNFRFKLFPVKLKSK